MNFDDINKIFKDCEIKDDKILIKQNLASTLEFIKNNYSFDLLKEIIATDNGNNSIELTYVLYSIENDEDVKISINIENNEAESVKNIFYSAQAEEKEIYDLFGINFIGHDNLERLYMPESWKGHPLRKDYEENDERLNWND